MNFTKTQKSRYVEKETLFFLQIKKIINCSRLLIHSLITYYGKNSFVAEETFKV